MEFFKLSRPKRLNIILLLLALGGCSLFQPYIDRRREAGVSDPSKLYLGLSKPEAPAVCYNNWVSDYAEVKKLADNECVKCVGTPPQDKEEINQDEEDNEENCNGSVN